MGKFLASATKLAAASFYEPYHALECTSKSQDQARLQRSIFVRAIHGIDSASPISLPHFRRRSIIDASVGLFFSRAHGTLPSSCRVLKYLMCTDQSERPIIA